MKRALLSSLAGLVLGVAVAQPAAAEFQSIGNDPAVLYDAPTLRGIKTAVAPRGMPVEIVVVQNDWARVRDSAGALAWIEKKALVSKRTVIATDPVIVDVHASPDDSAPVVFRVQPGVLMDLVAPPAGGWVNVRHRDGQSGFVRVGSVWGE
jgi:SH3-like domain-containing protein